MRPEKNIRRVLVFTAIGLAMALSVNAQPSLSFYSFENQFNSSAYNPAFLSSQKQFAFSLFPVGGTSLGYSNQEVVRQLVVKFVSGKTTDKDYKDVLQSIASRSMFTQNIESNLLSIIFRSRSGYFNFRIKENEFFSAQANGTVSNFIARQGIQSTTIGQVQYLPAQAMHVREYSVGYSVPTRRNDLSVGIRAKLYFGKSTFRADISGSMVNESGNYFLRTGGKVYLSVPEGQIFNEDGTINSYSLFQGSKVLSYLTNVGNPGFGVDLGINYRINRDLTFSASVIDIGKINWRTNLNSKNLEGKIPIQTDFTSSVDENGNEIITKTLADSTFLSSISNLYQITYDTSEFSQWVPATVYVGLKYQHSPDLKFSMVDRYVYLKDLSYNSISFAVNYDLNPKLTVSTGYSMIGTSYVNFPLAFLMHKNFGQIYFGTDNMMAFLIPSLSDFASFSFGASFYINPRRNLYKDPTEHFPFYKPKKHKIRQGNGLIQKEYPEF